MPLPDLIALGLTIIVFAYLISRVIARTVFTERPTLRREFGDWPHISDDMKHGERIRHD